MSADIQTQSLTTPAQSVVLPKISYEEFLETHNGMHAEWVDGEVIVLSPPSKLHQRLVRWLSTILTLHIEATNLGELFFAPFQMRLGPDLPGREPDILFVVNERADLLKKNYLDGPADLAVEVVSPDSVTRDRADKFLEYEKGGVREYWLIDPERKLAEFYQLDNGVYRLARIGDDGLYRSAVIGGIL